MRIAPGFSIVYRTDPIQPVRTSLGWLIGGLLASLFIWSPALTQEPPLPKPIGALNDYAAAIGNSRPALESALAALQNRAGIQATILITLLDPFDDPTQLATRIIADWKIPQEKAVFALYVKETDHWAFRLWLSPDLTASFAGKAQSSLEAQIAQDLQQRRVSQAVQETVDALVQAFMPPEPPKPPPTSTNPPRTQDANPKRSFGLWNSLALYGGAGLLALLLLVIGVRTLLYSFCPRCAGRLRARHGRSHQVYYYCERCGATFVRPRAR